MLVFIHFLLFENGISGKITAIFFILGNLSPEAALFSGEIISFYFLMFHKVSKQHLQPAHKAVIMKLDETNLNHFRNT